VKALTLNSRDVQARLDFSCYHFSSADPPQATSSLPPVEPAIHRVISS